MSINNVKKMENEEKKPKRPRIGYSRQGFINRDYQNSGNYDHADYSQRFDSTAAEPKSENDSEAQQNFQNNQNQERRYYQNNNGGGYRQNNGGYRQNNGGYRQNNAGGYRQQQYGGYRQNNGGYRSQGGYNNDGGYSSDEQQNNNGGYRQNNGGYRQNNGGYRQNNAGGYRQNNNGGYRQNNGGYRQNNNNNGGYRQNNGGYRQNNGGGGYQQGGFNRRPQQQRPRPGKSFVPRPKRIEYEMPIPDPNEQVRLNKFMANAGICSRREADEFIQQGLVKVNGTVVTELGSKISPVDVVEFKDEVVTLQSKCYILLNKPKDCVTTSDDPNGRTTVMDLVKGACNERIYPVGRLDRNTLGLLLLTNDGELAKTLTHPSHEVSKLYHVTLDKPLTATDFQKIEEGLLLEDGPIKVDKIDYVVDDPTMRELGVEIHSGRNHIVRRIFESLGYEVMKLDRVMLAGLTKQNLPRGHWRFLTGAEIGMLKRIQ